MAAKKQTKRRVYCDSRQILMSAEAHLQRRRLQEAGNLLLEAMRRLLYGHCVYYGEFPKHTSDLRAMVRVLNNCGAFESEGMARLLYAIIHTGEACLRGEGNAKHVASALALSHALCNGSTKELRQPARESSAACNLFARRRMAGGRV